MRRFALISAMLAMCFVARQAHALFGLPANVGVGGGVSVPLNDVSDALDDGWHATAQLNLVIPGSNFGITGEFNYNQFALDPAAYLGYAGTGEIISGIGNMTLNLPIPGPIQVYATAGLGAFVTKTLLDAANVPDPDSSTNFGVDAGLGARFKLFGAHAFLEGSFQNIYTSEDGFNNAVVQNFDSQVIPITFGLTF